MRHRRLTIAAAIAVCAALVATSSPATADLCTARKLKAVGKLESALLACQAKLASTVDGTALGACRTRALDKFATVFAKAGACSGDQSACLASAENCETQVKEAIIDALPSNCVAAKRKAAGKFARSSLVCHSKAANKGVAMDPRCMEKAAARFQGAFARAEADGACPDGGDPQALLDDSCVSPAVIVDARMVTEACPDSGACGSVDDGDACTEDACVSGTATHTPVSTDDGNACTTDACDSLTGVSHTSVPVDDGDVCTADTCNPATGAVSHGPANVDDGNACTVDSCTSGGTTEGITHTPLSIDDGDNCTVDSCDAATGNISHAPVDVDDGNACTADSCLPGTIDVVHLPITTDDGDFCTIDSCDPASGVSHTPVGVDDGDACTTDACDPFSGVSHAPASADDGDFCTVDSCDPIAGISHTPVNVDDGDACTIDSCTSQGTSQGISHTPVPINDGNPCTSDSCDPVTGVSHAYTGDDGVCPAGRVCSPSGCVPN